MESKGRREIRTQFDGVGTGNVAEDAGPQEVMQTNEDNWESFGNAHGVWRTSTSTKAFGELSVLIHSTSDRSAPTQRQIDAVSRINDLPTSQHDELLALIAEHYGEVVEDVECAFDLAEIPLIDQTASTYNFLDGGGPDYEHRVTILFRDNEILGIVDRDAASEIHDWDSIAEIEALVFGIEGFDDDED